MRILFIASAHMNLYKIIEKEMMCQGHEVYTVIDYHSNFDPGKVSMKIEKSIRMAIWEIDLRWHWRTILKKREFSQPFDLLFVLTGCSVNDYFINRIKRCNPNIKSVLYTWDTINSYPFDRLLPYFNKAYSFDINDVQNDKRWKLLPIFYVENNIHPNVGCNYNLFSVGTNHSCRYQFIKNIKQQLLDTDIRYYFKIVATPERKSFLHRIYDLIVGVKELSLGEQLQHDFSLGLIDKDMLLRSPLPEQEYNKLISESICVLDDQNDMQSGLSARFMWALGHKKKILTTNRFAFKYNFINKAQVFVIDKQNPVVPLDFIRKPLSLSDASDISFVKINNWVKEILS